MVKRIIASAGVLFLVACGIDGRVNPADPERTCGGADQPACACPKGWTLTWEGKCACLGTASAVGDTVVCQGPEDLRVELSYIPADAFRMGASVGDAQADTDEVPSRTIAFSQPFLMARTEVTQAQYLLVMGSNPSYFYGMDRPVEQVTWLDAIEFCNRLSVLHGLTPAYDGTRLFPAANGYRLPTEAQWEYAARAGIGEASYDPPDLIAWYGQNAQTGTNLVGQFLPNAWGLYDMIGNVWEWTGDWYGNYPASGFSETNPMGPDSGDQRVIRGGGWFNDLSNMRASNRTGLDPDMRGYGLGFRPVRPASL